MSERTQSPDGDRPTRRARRSGVSGAGVRAAVAVTAALVVVGVIALVLGLRGTSGTPGPPQPAAAGVPSAGTSTSGPSASPGQGGTPSAGPSPSTSTGTRPSAEPRASDPNGFGDFLEASEPTSIEIPSIGVRSSHFVPLSIQRDGTISVPGTAQEVGLYDAGPTPGQLGPAVFAAHVDTPSGVPGIFYELGKVRAGDVVKVSRRDGTHLRFTVDKVAAYKKTRFPTEAVYRGDFTKAEIRLVTCGGPTDSRNEYRDNVVVFGHLTGTS